MTYLNSDKPQASLPSDNLYAVLEEMTWGIIKVTDARQGFIYLSDPRLESFVPLLALGKLTIFEKQTFQTEILAPSTDLLINELITRGEPVILFNAKNHLVFRNSIADVLKIESLIALPIMSNGKVLGAALFTKLEHTLPFDADQIHLTSTMVNAMGLALENVRLYENANDKLVQLQSFHQITSALLEKSDLREILKVICEEACRLSSASASAVFLLQNQYFDLTYLYPEAISSRIAPNLLQERCHAAIDRKEPIVYNNSMDEPLQSARSAQLLIPLIAHDNPIGILEIDRESRGYSVEETRILNLFANQVSVAIEVSRLYAQVKNVAVLQERQRIARDLHDSVSQSLYAINLLAKAAVRHMKLGNMPVVQNHLEQLSATSREALGEMRMMIFELRPPLLQEKGLVKAIDARLKSVEERTGHKIQFTTNLIHKLPEIVEDGIYRIAQESLNNILKYADASTIKVHLSENRKSVRLTVSDDGEGFAVEEAKKKGGLGIRTMQERAQSIGAKLTLQSKPDSGTKVTLEIPK
jgi:signal transduction histidine kinase